MATPLPLYIKITCILFLLCILFFLFYIGQGIILPLGFLIAVLLFPLNKKMTNIGLPRVVGILVALLIAAIVLVALIMFLLPGLFFVDDLPAVKRTWPVLFKRSRIDRRYFSRQQTTAKPGDYRCQK